MFNKIFNDNFDVEDFESNNVSNIHFKKETDIMRDNLKIKYKSNNLLNDRKNSTKQKNKSNKKRKKAK